MYISDNVNHLQLFNNHLWNTIWAARWGNWVWQLKYVKFWPFCSFSRLPLLIAFSFVLVSRRFFLLYQMLTHLWTWSVRKSFMVIPDVLIGNRAFRALLDRRFLTSDLMIFIWLNSLSSDLIQAHRDISKLLVAPPSNGDSRLWGKTFCSKIQECQYFLSWYNARHIKQ